MFDFKGLSGCLALQLVVLAQPSVHTNGRDRAKKQEWQPALQSRQLKAAGSEGPEGCRTSPEAWDAKNACKVSCHNEETALFTACIYIYTYTCHYFTCHICIDIGNLMYVPSQQPRSRRAAGNLIFKVHSNSWHHITIDDVK